MVPPPLVLELADDEDERQHPAAHPGVRLGLVVIMVCWLAVFAIAAYLNPYGDNGEALREQTHRQLGLPACNFRVLTDLPCPSCGMSTSFALLVRGDVVNSLRANFAGTMLAGIGLVFLPWSVLSMWRGRWLWVRSVEPWLIRIVFGWVAVMLLRWVALLIWMRLS